MAELLPSTLLLQDGTVFHGESWGYQGLRMGEVVFNTSMTGYQEVLTDPSYAGQIVALTYPLIGNYGINKADFESSRIHVKAFIVGEACEVPSNFRSSTHLNHFLKEHKIVGIQGIDVRELTRKIRVHGEVEKHFKVPHRNRKGRRRKLDCCPRKDCKFGLEFTLLFS